MLLATLNLFPPYSLDTSILVAVLVGVLVLALLTETLGWVFVGLVVPGYLASVFVIHPETGATVVVEALVTYGFAVFLSSVCRRTGVWSEFFGRDCFFAVLLSSVLVREVFELALLPKLGLFLDRQYGTTFALDRTLHSVGLVLVPLTANGFWKLGLRRGLFQVGVPVLITYGILQLVLLPATNLSFSSLELMYEDIARSFLASPKAYILLLITAVVAARFNVRYGWDFNGILVPALIGLTWLSPTKLVGTFAEVLMLVLMTRALLTLPGIRTLNLEGPRKTVLVFVLGFALKWAIGWALGGRVPGLKVTDLFGFGYLVPTLLAVKILQKQVAARISLAAVHTSLAGFLIGSFIGFDLSVFEPKSANAADGNAIALVTQPVLSQSELGVLALARASARQVDSPEPPMPTNRSSLRAYADLWKQLDALLTNETPETIAKAQQCALAQKLELRQLQGAPRKTWILKERVTLAGRSGFDTALLMPGAKGPVLLVPRPVSEAPTAEASLALCHRVDCSAIIVSGLDTVKQDSSRGDALVSIKTPLQAAREVLEDRERIILRADADATPGKPTLHRASNDSATDALWPGAARSNKAPRTSGYDWDEAKLTTLVAHPDDLTRLVAEDAPDFAPAIADAELLKALSSNREDGRTPGPDLTDDELIVLDQLVSTITAKGAGPLSMQWARKLSTLFGLQLHPLTPCNEGARCFVLQPKSDADANSVKATLVFRSDGAPIVLQVPVPVREQGTLPFTLELYRQLHAKAVIIASESTRSGEPVRTAFHAYHQALHRELPTDGFALQLRGYDSRPGAPAHSVVVALDRPVLEEKDRMPQVDALFAEGGPLAHLAGHYAYADGSLPLAWANDASAQQLYVRTFGGGRMATLWLSTQLRGAYLPMRLVDEQLTALNLPAQRGAMSTLLLGQDRKPLAGPVNGALQQKRTELERLCQRLLATQNPQDLKALLDARANGRSRAARWNAHVFSSDEAGMPFVVVEATEGNQQLRALYFLQEAASPPVEIDLSQGPDLATAHVEAALRQRRPVVVLSAAGSEPLGLNMKAGIAVKLRTSLFALLGLGAALVLVWASSALVVDAAYSDTANAESRFEQAERLLFYRIAPGETLSLLVPPDAESVRVFSHLILPKGADSDPSQRFVYGLNLKLWDPEGAQLFDRELYTRTRQSKADRTETGWAQRAVFLTDPTAEVTDGRDFLLRLPPTLRARATSPALLLVKHSGNEGTLLVRVSARFPKVARLVAMQTTSAVDRASERVERATFVPWEQLPEQTQEVLAAESWQRLGARGELGEDYRVEAVYRTEFRLPANEPQEDEDSQLAPQRAVAINIQGPASVGLRLWSEQGGATANATLVQRSVDGTVKTVPVTLQSTLVTSQTLEVGEGLHTLELHNQSAETLRYSLLSSSRAVPGSKPTAATESDELIRLAPDRRDSDVYLVGDGAMPVTLDLPDSDDHDDTSRLIRVDARAVAFGSDTLAPTKLTLTMQDASGNMLGQAQLDLGADAAPFEGLTVPDNSLADVEGLVGPSSVGRVFLPRGATRLTVTADRRAAVALFANVGSPKPVVHQAPYLDDALGRTRWRSAPLDARSWFPLRPSNHVQLLQTGARAQLWSLVRLEPTGGDDANAVAEMMTVLPLGRPASVELMEQVAHADDGQVWTKLSANTASSMTFSSADKRRPELHLFTDTSALGQPVELLVDGKVVYKKPLRSTRARVLLPPVSSGDHIVQVRGPALTALLNRPAASEPMLKARTAYELTSRGLRLKIYKPSQDALTLNVLVYSKDSAQTCADTGHAKLKVLLDDGAPKRRSGILLERVSLGRRELPLVKSADCPAALQLSTSAQWFAHPLAVTLGEDLPPGTHYIDITPEQAGEELWARFFIRGNSTDTETRQWNRSGWDEGAF